MTAQYWGTSQRVRLEGRLDVGAPAHRGSARSTSSEPSRERPAEAARHDVGFSDDAADPEKTSRVIFEIEPYKDDAVSSRSRTASLSPAQRCERHRAGWPLVLSSLKSFLETGEGHCALLRKKEPGGHDRRQQVQAEDRLRDLHRLHAGEGVGRADRPEFTRQYFGGFPSMSSRKRAARSFCAIRTGASICLGA